jgi:hypothetical protein
MRFSIRRRGNDHFRWNVSHVITACFIEVFLFLHIFPWLSSVPYHHLHSFHRLDLKLCPLARKHLDVHSGNLNTFFGFGFLHSATIGCFLLSSGLQRCELCHLTFNPLIQKKRRVGIGSQTLFAVSVELIQ